MFYLVVLTWIVSGCAIDGKVTCVNERGMPVDMYILYKLPKLEDSDVPLVRSGYAYAYLDSSDYKFHLSKWSVGDNSSAPAKTLSAVYSTNEDLAHVFYNDENPDGSVYFTCGHTKGALAFDGVSGFWLINSVPKFPPPASAGYGYPHSGTLYGQMFICVTFNSTVFNEIGLQLRFDNPHVHDASLPPSMTKDFPNIASLLKGDIISKPPFNSKVTLRSLGGVEYIHFGKTNDFQADLYHDFVAETLRANLLVETWQHDTKKVIGPSCNGYTVEDASQIDVITDRGSFSFNNLLDHSKFAVGKSSSYPYVCVGDINRETSQFHRGGGTLCLKNSYLWNTFYGMVTKYNGCV